MRKPDLIIVPHPDLLYAQTNTRIIPVTPLSKDSNIQVIESGLINSNGLVDIASLQPGILGKYDAGFNLVFVYPRGTDPVDIQQSSIKWGHHLFPFSGPASRCIRSSYGGSNLGLN
jgi:hypothetical protein